MKHSKELFLSGIVTLALMWASNASATVIYDVITDAFGGTTTGQISFAVADNFVGLVDQTDVASFTWDASLIGDPFAPDPSQWQISNLLGNLDATNSLLQLFSYTINTSNGFARLDISGASTVPHSGTYEYDSISATYYNQIGRVWLQAVQNNVPAPMVLGLLSLGLVGVGAATKRRNRKH
jgi:hypothetical protein